MKDKLKMEIVRTAKVMLQEGKDIKQITMNSIANRMKITAPTLYHYFKGKEEIIAMSIEMSADELIEIFEAPLPQGFSAEMKLKMRLVSLMTYFYKNLNSFSLIFSDLGLSTWGYNEQPIIDKVAIFKKKLSEVLGEWLKSEKIKLEEEKALYLFLSIMMGVLRFYKASNIKNADMSVETETVFSYFKKAVS